MNDYTELFLHQTKRREMDQLREVRRKRRQRNKIRRIIFKILVVVNTIIFAVSISTLDSDSWIPTILLVASLLFLSLASKVGE